MPNLDYDPKNPTDLLDRPIAVGDYVAWGTTYGRSPAVAVCRIEHIRFLRKNPNYPHSTKEFVECDQQAAEKYQLILAPLKSTGSTSYPEEYVPDGFVDEDGRVRHFRRTANTLKTKRVHLVKNVVKLEAL